MKNERFNLRMTTEEKEKIKEKARKAGLPVSKYMINAAMEQEFILIDALPEMVHELKGIGRNLNQLALLANVDRIKTVRLHETEEKLAEIYFELRKLTEGM